MAKYRIVYIELVSQQHTGVVDADSAEDAIKKVEKTGYGVLDDVSTDESETKIRNGVLTATPIYEGFMGNINAKQCERCKLTIVDTKDLSVYCANCGHQLKFAEVFQGTPIKTYRYVSIGETIKDVREESIKMHNAD